MWNRNIKFYFVDHQFSEVRSDKLNMQVWLDI